MATETPQPGPPQPAVLVDSSKPLRIILEQGAARGLARFGRWLLFTILGISLIMNFDFLSSKMAFEDEDGVVERYHSLSKDAHDKIAIIDVEGAILHSDGFVKKQIDRARKDETVKAVVLRVDSPGGTVTGSDYLYHHLQELVADRKIPMVVSMASVAASGGYYIAMAAGDKEHSIYAEPTTWTGSIGVIIPHYDLSSLLTRWDIADDSISSHPLKQMGSLTHQVSKEEREEERAILKGLVDDSFGRFKEIVLKSRSALRNNPEWQADVFTGRIFAADQAKARGLVDDLGYIEDAIDQAVTQAGLSKSRVKVVKYTKHAGLFDALLSAEIRSGAAPASLKADLAALVDLTTPRAFYLCSWAPALGSAAGH